MKLKLLISSGFCGSILIISSSLFTAMFYRGNTGESYSALNHYISELGQIGVSRFAPVFNIGLIVGCIFLAVFLADLGRFIGGIFGRLFLVMGIVTGLSGALVGVFPMNNMHVHVPVAMTFFRSAMILSVIFSGYVLFSRATKFRKYVSIPGILTAFTSFIFVFISESAHHAAKPLAVSSDVRPEIWLAPLLEWSVFFTVLAWVLTVTIYLKRHGSSSLSE